MSWLRRYRVRLYLLNSIRLFPAPSIVAGLVTAALLTRLERAFGWEMTLTQP